MKKSKTPTTVALLICIVSPSIGLSQSGAHEWLRAHSQGNLQQTFSAIGYTGWLPAITAEPAPYVDPITGDSVWGCEYPRNSRNVFFTSWPNVGAIIGSDTLVSGYDEYHSIARSNSEAWHLKSNDPTSSCYSADARSELDMTCTYTDTAFAPAHPVDWDNRPHIPMGIEIIQTSMAWSSDFIDDFIIVTYELRNIGDHYLEDVYYGVNCHSGYTNRHQDLTGFIRRWPYQDQCGVYDTINVAYLMDNDGDPVNNSFGPDSRRGAVGVVFLGGSFVPERTGYNWFVWRDDYLSEDWGPRREASLTQPFRRFSPYFAYPGGDCNLYYLMATGEVDYDQMFAALDHTAQGWLPPWDYAKDAARAGWSEFLYSFGPFDLQPKEAINFTIAYVGGDNVHTNPYAVFDPESPQLYYAQLDFSELAENARWAKWVYDNPGVDTDSDGYRGEYRVCRDDTVWYQGDGVPDFRANTPPPAPVTRFTTEPGRIVVRFNGFESENVVDPFSGLRDFEGYRIYLGLDDRRSSLSLLSSYDRENFFRFKWYSVGLGQGKWLNDDPPYSLDSLRILHNDPNFDPLRYDRNRPLIEGDSVFRFEMVDQNRSQLGLPHGIRKAYPDAVDPGTDSLLWTESDITREHGGRALPKFYEYEYTIDQLMPTVPYYVAITAFDFGFSGGRGKTGSQESNPLNALSLCYAQESSESVEEERLDVYVYPNPYRDDADYAARGYENRKGDIIPDRARVIHFANLPHKCRISVYSLDGDLIGVRTHDYPKDDPSAMHDTWNLVSRSGLAVESGLYYWVVESDTRTQIGKLVIIK